MRILLVNTTEHNGGAAIAANRLMSALNDNGVKAKMLVSKKESQNLSVVGLNSLCRYRYHFLKERFEIFLANRFDKTNLFAVDTASAGTDITKTKEFKEADVIHLHWINQGFLSLKDIRKIIDSGKPIVWTLHDMWEFTGICHYANNCDKYKTECHHCPFLKSPGARDLSNLVFRKKNKLFAKKNVHFVAVSSWLANCAKESHLLRTQSIQVIPNVLPVSRYKIKDKVSSRQYFSLPEDKHVIVFGAVKIDEQRKGLKYLNQALQRLIDQEIYKKDDFHLALFGGIKQADVLDEIPVPYTYLGFLKNDEELSSLYSAADVAAIPSLYETFGQTVVETQACGCVPVTFTGSGQMDIITHLQNGYLAEYLSVEDFAKGIQWAISRQTERIALRESAVKRYSERTIALRYIDLYNQICKGEE